MASGPITSWQKMEKQWKRWTDAEAEEYFGYLMQNDWKRP